MINRRNYYRILQVQKDAPMEVIRSSYRTLMHTLKQHPDLGGDTWNAALLNEAYETLSNSGKRAAYDRQYSNNHGKRDPCRKRDDRSSVLNFSCPFCTHTLSNRDKSMQKCSACRSPLRMSTGADLIQSSRNRRTARVLKSGKLQYYTSWPLQGRDADMIDLSTGGIRFKCGDPLELNAIIKLSSPMLEALVTVNNSSSVELDGRTYYSIGAQFLTNSFTQARGTFVSTVA